MRIIVVSYLNFRKDTEATDQSSEYRLKGEVKPKRLCSFLRLSRCTHAWSYLQKETGIMGQQFLDFVNYIYAKEYLPATRFMPKNICLHNELHYTQKITDFVVKNVTATKWWLIMTAFCKYNMYGTLEKQLLKFYILSFFSYLKFIVWWDNTNIDDYVGVIITVYTCVKLFAKRDRNYGPTILRFCQLYLRQGISAGN